jgi:hypothetical protein
VNIDPLVTVYIAQIVVVGGYCVYQFIQAIRYRTQYNVDRSVVTEYGPPAGISPMMCGVLLDKRLNTNDVTAGIVSLVQSGVVQVDTIAVGDRTDYVLRFVALPKSVEHGIQEQVLLDILFRDGRVGATVLLSSITGNANLRRQNRRLVLQLERIINRDLMALGYFEELSPERVFALTMPKLWASLVLMIMVHLGTQFYLYIVGIPPIEFSMFMALALMCASFISTLISVHRRTQAGYDAQYHVRGFAEYLRVAEQKRYEFENELTDKALSYKDNLAYAIALGVTDSWGPVFAKIQNTLTREP